MLWPQFAAAQQAVPDLSGRVIDTTLTLDSADKARIEARLAQIEQTRGAQIVVLLITTTAPEDIASYANRVANAWKIGRSGGNQQHHNLRAARLFDLREPGFDARFVSGIKR